MTFEEAQRLVHIPKWVVDEDGNNIEPLMLEQKFPMQFRLHLVSNEDYPREYVLDVKQSEKFGIRLNPPLAWALPLEETEIETKDVEQASMANDFIDAFNSFASYLNIQTTITINPMML